MKKEFVQSLQRRAKEASAAFSNPDRALNTNKEIFTIHEIKPLSENTAAVIFQKEPTHKKALAFFYYVNGGGEGGYWAYFFPTDSHILGLRKIEDLLLEIEQYNFKLND